MRETMRCAFVLLLALSCGSRAWAASPCAGQDKLAAWHLLQSKAPKDPEAQARAVEEFRAECGFYLEFWPGPKAQQSQKDDHPCGEAVIAFVKSIPSPSDPVMQSEEVFELGPSGKVIQRWWIPIDSTVAGIAGDEILITEELGPEVGIFTEAGLADRFSIQLAISPRGRFRVVPVSASAPATPFTCPSNRDLPHPSSYLGCWKFSDQRSQAERRLAYEAPCT